MNFITRPLVVLSVLSLAACAGTTVPNTYATPTMSNQQYMAMSAEQRQGYLGAVAAEDRAITEKNDVEYLAGRPIHYGDSRTGYTVMWAKRAGQIMFFPGHSSGAFGQESQAILTLAADEHGRPRLANGVPIVLSASASHQEGLGRFFARGAFQVLGAAMNGVIGAKITADATCSSNCGSPTYVQTNVGTNVDLGVNVTDTCTSCAPAPLGRLE